MRVFVHVLKTLHSSAHRSDCCCLPSLSGWHCCWRWWEEATPPGWTLRSPSHPVICPCSLWWNTAAQKPLHTTLTLDMVKKYHSSVYGLVCHFFSNLKLIAGGSYVAVILYIELWCFIRVDSNNLLWNCEVLWLLKWHHQFSWKKTQKKQVYVGLSSYTMKMHPYRLD